MVITEVWGTRRWIGPDEPAEIRRTDHCCQACGRSFTIRSDALAWSVLGGFFALIALGGAVQVGLGAIVLLASDWDRGLPGIGAAMVLLGIAWPLGHASLALRARPERYPEVAGAEAPALRLGAPRPRRCRCGQPAPCRSAWIHAGRGGGERSHACVCGRSFTVYDGVALLPGSVGAVIVAGIGGYALSEGHWGVGGAAAVLAGISAAIVGRRWMQRLLHPLVS